MGSSALIQLFEEYGIPYKVKGQHHHTTADFIQIDCPWCSPGESKFRLGVHKTAFFTCCWVCGYHKLEKLVEEITKDKPRQCWEFVRSLRAWQGSTREFKRTGELKLPPGVGNLLNPHWHYLKDRKFADPCNLARAWDLGGIGADAPQHLRWRVFIPIHYQGKVVSWTTRAIGDKEPRYYSARDEDSTVSPDNLLYGFDHVRHCALVVEGPVDVWAVGYGAVALLGQQLTQARLEQLSRVPIRYICFDAEPAAQARARKLADALSPYSGTTANLVLQTGKDPASAEQYEIEELRRLVRGES